METKIQLPKAFSVRDDHEFDAFKHLMLRLNPELRVRQIGLGLHLSNNYTVFWGLVYLHSQPLTEAIIHEALREAGFNFEHDSAQLDYSLGA